MTTTIQTELVPLRKDHLRYQISEALELGASEKLNCLKAQWVHRFGIESLKESELKTLDSSYSKSVQVLPLKEKGSFTNFKKEKKIEDLNNLVNESNSTNLENSLKDEFSTSKDESHKESEEDVSYSLTQELGDSVSKELNRMDIAPPPIPSLSHLRRWLPSIGHSISKAS